MGNNEKCNYKMEKVVDSEGSTEWKFFLMSENICFPCVPCVTFVFTDFPESVSKCENIVEK